MAHLPQMRSFFQKNIQYISHVPLSPFHCAKFQKKFLERIQSYEDAQFFDLKMTNLPQMRISSEKPLI